MEGTPTLGENRIDVDRALTEVEDAAIPGNGIGAAAANIVRVLAIVGCLLTLVLARWGAPIFVLVALVALSLVTLFALDRGTARFGLWAAYLVGFVLFALLRTEADNVGFPVHTHYAVAADEWLFGGTLPQRWLQDHLYHGSASVLVVFCVAVIFSYYVVPHVVALGLWSKRPAEFKRYALAILIAAYTGLAVSVLVPTAPPWLASTYTAAPHVSRIEAEFLRWNPESIGTGGPVPGVNPIAAMPSLHIALTALIVVALWRFRALRFASIAYVGAMMFSLVFMGEHYVVDVLAGLATATFAWVLASRIVGTDTEQVPADETVEPDASAKRAA